MLALSRNVGGPGLNIIGPNGDLLTIDIKSVDEKSKTAVLDMTGSMYSATDDWRRLPVNGRVFVTHRPTGKVVIVQAVRIHPISQGVKFGISADKEFNIYRRELIVDGRNA